MFSDLITESAKGLVYLAKGSGLVFAPCQLLPTMTAVTWVAFSPPFVVYLSVFPHSVSKTDAARITRLAWKCSTMSPGKTFILGHQRLKSRVMKPVSVRVFAHCECWLLIVA